MGDLLGIGLNSLLGFQQALNTTSQNIANVNNADYARRTTQFVSSGSGMQAQVVRNVDQFILNNLRNITSFAAQSSDLSTHLQTLEQMLDNASTNLSTGLSTVFTGLQGVNTDPTSTAARQMFINNLNALTSQFTTVGSQLGLQVRNVNTALSNFTGEVNNILSSIASSNAAIAGDSTGNLDLHDIRDSQLRQLAQYVSIDTINNGDGTINVTISGGAPLVIGSKAATLDTAANAENPLNLDITSSFGGTSSIVTDLVSGGKFGAAIQYRDQLSSLLNQYGRLAISVSDEFNQQNQLGMDLNNDLGDDLFSDLTTADVNKVQANANNTGTANMSVSISSANDLTTSNYRLSVTMVGAVKTYTLTRLSDNAAVVSGNFSAGNPATISADGFTINVNAWTANVGDNYLVVPTQNAAAQMAVAVTDPKLIAVASPVRASSVTTNTGTGSLSITAVTDTSTSLFSAARVLSPPLSVRFISGTTYQIYNETTGVAISGILTYDPSVGAIVFPNSALAAPYDAPGFTSELAGAPAAGDKFVIQYNTDGVSNSANGQAMAALQTSKVLGNSTQSLSDAYSQISANIATSTQAATLSEKSNTILLNQIQSQRSALSGVNLDEEAANSLLYQQAYTSGAKIMSIADNTFQSLMSLFR